MPENLAAALTSDPPAFWTQPSEEAYHCMHLSQEKIYRPKGAERGVYRRLEFTATSPR
jgi:hypothetical protein